MKGQYVQAIVWTQLNTCIFGSDARPNPSRTRTKVIKNVASSAEGFQV